jgi:uncharacterized membrane protein
MLRFLATNPYNITADQIGLPTTTATVGDALVNITKLLMSAVGGLALIFIVVAGIQMALSAGNSKRFMQARETLLYAVVGLAVSIAALAIVTFISNSVNGGH